MSNRDPLEMLTKAFQNMGAGPEQARTMAAQLLKRAGQLSEQEKISGEAALARLMEKVIAARRGEYGSSEPEQ